MSTNVYGLTILNGRGNIANLTVDSNNSVVVNPNLTLVGNADNAHIFVNNGDDTLYIDGGNKDDGGKLGVEIVGAEVTLNSSDVLYVDAQNDITIHSLGKNVHVQAGNTIQLVSNGLECDCATGDMIVDVTDGDVNFTVSGQFLINGSPISTESETTALSQAISVPSVGTLGSPSINIDGGGNVTISDPLIMAPNQSISVTDGDNTTTPSENSGMTYFINSTPNGLYTNQAIENDFFQFDNVGVLQQWSNSSPAVLNQSIDASGNLNLNGCGGYNFDNNVNIGTDKGIDYVNSENDTAHVFLDPLGYLELQTSNSNGIWLNNLLGTENNIQLYGGVLQVHGDSILQVACDHSSGVGQFTGCPSYSFDHSITVLGDVVQTSINGSTSCSRSVVF